MNLTQFERECFKECKNTLDSLRLKVNLRIINNDVHHVRQNIISNVGYIGFNIYCAGINRTISWEEYDSIFLQR